MKKYCPYCGKQSPDNAQFCADCGAALGRRNAAPNGYDAQKEKNEAAAAGRQALGSLRAALSELDKARGWGVVDLLGGGLITSLAKRSKMSRAQQLIECAKRDLRTFRNELDDVAELRGININVDDFLSFADWFFDGFTVDFLVQDKINRARAQVAEAIDRMEQLLRYLDR